MKRVKLLEWDKCPVQRTNTNIDREVKVQDSRLRFSKAREFRFCKSDKT